MHRLDHVQLGLRSQGKMDAPEQSEDKKLHQVEAEKDLEVIS